MGVVYALLAVTALYAVAVSAQGYDWGWEEPECVVNEPVPGPVNTGMHLITTEK
ncbi:hypothetical protein KIPB_008456, partial [Kipferlia bialata]|eukprot:g8456.t1